MKSQNSKPMRASADSTRRFVQLKLYVGWAQITLPDWTQSLKTDPQQSTI